MGGRSTGRESWEPVPHRPSSSLGFAGEGFVSKPVLNDKGLLSLSAQMSFSSRA